MKISHDELDYSAHLHQFINCDGMPQCVVALRKMLDMWNSTDLKPEQIVEITTTTLATTETSSTTTPPTTTPGDDILTTEPVVIPTDIDCEYTIGVVLSCLNHIC